jgi:hypothetical protein
MALLSFFFFLGGTLAFHQYLWLRLGALTVQQIVSVITVAFIAEKKEGRLHTKWLIATIGIQIALWLFASLLPLPPMNQ